MWEEAKRKERGESGQIGRVEGKEDEGSAQEDRKEGKNGRNISGQDIERKGDNASEKECEERERWRENV